MVSKARMMYKKYPKLFMEMWLHSEEENPGRGDDISVIYSKIMSNVGHPDNYWMPDEADGFTKEEILKDFAGLIIDPKEVPVEEVVKEVVEKK